MHIELTWNWKLRFNWTSTYSRHLSPYVIVFCTKMCIFLSTFEPQKLFFLLSKRFIEENTTDTESRSFQSSKNVKRHAWIISLHQIFHAFIIDFIKMMLQYLYVKCRIYSMVHHFPILLPCVTSEIVMAAVHDTDVKRLNTYTLSL